MEGDWKVPPQRVRVPYMTWPLSAPEPRVRPGTRNLAGSREDHLPRLNIPLRPIVHEYREGKVKSTPVWGVKEFLKPHAYKQSEDDREEQSSRV